MRYSGAAVRKDVRKAVPKDPRSGHAHEKERARGRGQAFIRPFRKNADPIHRVRRYGAARN